MAAHKLQGRRTWKGLDISIENRKGSVRRWNDGQRSGSTEMKWAYGYVRRTQAADGDHVDVYLGPDPDGASHVYVVRQMAAPTFERYDEDKCMIGWPSEAAARLAYLGQYDDPRFLGRIDAIPVDRFVRQAQKTFDRPGRVQKAIPRPPGAGWQAIPGGKKGGWRKPDGKGGWTYDYADRGRTGHGEQLGLFDWAAPKPRQPLPNGRLEQYRAEVAAWDYRQSEVFKSIVKRASLDMLARLPIEGEPAPALVRAVNGYQRRFVSLVWDRHRIYAEGYRPVDLVLYRVKQAGDLAAVRAEVANGSDLFTALLTKYGGFAGEVDTYGWDAHTINNSTYTLDDWESADRVKSDLSAAMASLQFAGAAFELRQLYTAMLPQMREGRARTAVEAGRGLRLDRPTLAAEGLSGFATRAQVDGLYDPTLPRWGYAVSTNAIAAATAVWGDSGRFRPLDRDMNLTRVRRASDEGAMRRYVYAQDKMEEASREKYPVVYRGMQIPASAARLLDKGSIIPLTGCTSFSFDLDTAEDYSTNETSASNGREDASVVTVPVLIDLARDEVFDATVAGWSETEGRRSGTAFEIVSGANALKVLAVREEDYFGGPRYHITVRAILEGDSVSKSHRPTRDSAWRRAVVVFNQALADQPLRQGAPPTHKARRVGLADLVKAADGHKYIRRATPKRKTLKKVKKGGKLDLVSDHMPESVAGAGSLVALACANAAGVRFEEFGAPPPKSGEALKKVEL